MVREILEVRPAGIWTPGTLRVSHGTKFFGSKFFSTHESEIIFHTLLPNVLQKDYLTPRFVYIIKWDFVIRIFMRIFIIHSLRT